MALTNQGHFGQRQSISSLYSTIVRKSIIYGDPSNPTFICILRPFSPLLYIIPDIILSVADYWYWLGIGMSSFIESELKSRLFDNQLSKTQDDDLPLFSFYSLLFINFYVKDKISFISLLFLKRFKKPKL